jgi:hypothetical protein
VKISYALACGLVGFLLLGIGLGDNPFGYASFLLALGFGLGAIIHMVSSISIRKKDPYDLRELLKVQADEERRAIEDQLAEIDSAGNAVCLNCGTHFDPMLHRCPRCGKSIYSGGCCN